MKLTLYILLRKASQSFDGKLKSSMPPNLPYAVVIFLLVDTEQFPVKIIKGKLYVGDLSFSLLSILHAHLHKLKHLPKHLLNAGDHS